MSSANVDEDGDLYYELDAGGGGGAPAADPRVTELEQKVAELESLLRLIMEQLFPLPDSSGGGGTDVQLIKISSNATGGGYYNGNVWTAPTGSIPTSSTLSEAAMGSAGAACIYANLTEVASATHDLTNASNTRQKLYVGVYRGTNSGGVKVYASTGLWLEDCT